MMRSCAAAVALWLALAAGAPADAAADLTRVTFSVATVHVDNTVETVTARFEVAGERITRATLKPPLGTAVELVAAGDLFVLEAEFASETELARSFPDGEYLLTLNGTSEYPLVLVRAPVLSPALSAPLPAEVLVPGPVEVEFTRCSICDEELDSTKGVLLVEQTKLVDAMTASTLGSVAVADAKKFPEDGSFDVEIGSERMTVSRLDDLHITVEERGVGGTSATAHAVNATVSEVLASDDTLRKSETALVDPLEEDTLGEVEVEDARVFPSGHPFDVEIGSEQLTVERIDDTQIDVIERGTGGTMPSAHDANEKVSEVGQSDKSWTPASELGENASFTATIVHTVVRGEPLVGPGNDAFDQVGIFSSEDSVSFFTGAGLPGGDFCVVVNDDGSFDAEDVAGCFVIEQESASLLDPSGSFETTAAGADVEYGAEVLAGGEITGEAAADLDDNGSFETVAPVRGRVSGSFGAVTRSLRFAFESTSPAAKLKVSIREDASVADGALEGTQRTRGTLLGAKVKEEQESEFPEADVPLAWLLEFTLDDKQVDTASLRLANGRTIPLTGRYVFDFLTDLGKLELKSAGEDAGVLVRIEELSIDDGVDPPMIDDGVLIYKILGQHGRAPEVR